MNDVVAVRVRGTLALAIAIALGAGNVHAATITVADGGDSGSSSTCTLRQAIESTNNDAAGSSNCASGAGDDTIEFSAPLANATITLDGAALDVANNLIIHGSDQTIDAAGGSRVVLIERKGNLTASSLTLTGGAATDGGGVYLKDEAYLTLTDTTISGNAANQEGGGIYAHSNNTIDIVDSTISGNQAGTRGGGMYGFRAVLTVSESTVSDNTATTHGGGIYVRDISEVDITNSTISGNTAGALGGGVYLKVHSAVEINNSTLAGNDANYGGALYLHQSSVFMVNSTIAANSAATSGGGVYAYIGGSAESVAAANTILAANTAPTAPDLYSDGVGTVAVSAAASLLGLALQTDLAGDGNLFNDTPGLGALQNNGGPTETMLLQVTSPAIDAGDNSMTSPLMTTDQRGTGFARIVNDTVDIGAVELQTNSDVIFRSGFEA